MHIGIRYYADGSCLLVLGLLHSVITTEEIYEKAKSNYFTPLLVLLPLFSMFTKESSKCLLPAFCLGKLLYLWFFNYSPNLLRRLKNQISFSWLHITKKKRHVAFPDATVLRFLITEVWKCSNIKTSTCYISRLIHTGTKAFI